MLAVINAQNEELTVRETCGVMYKCWDFSKRPCLRDKDHTGGHNPFSNTAPPLNVLITNQRYAQTGKS